MAMLGSNSLVRSRPYSRCAICNLCTSSWRWRREVAGALRVEGASLALGGVSAGLQRRMFLVQWSSSMTARTSSFQGKERQPVAASIRMDQAEHTRRCVFRFGSALSCCSGRGVSRLPRTGRAKPVDRCRQGCRGATQVPVSRLSGMSSSWRRRAGALPACRFQALKAEFGVDG